MATVEKVDKQEFLSKISALEKQGQAMERGVKGHCVELAEELRTSQQILKSELRGRLNNVKEKVRIFQAILSDMRVGVAYVEALKKAMEDIELLLSSFKESHRMQYEELLLGERTLWVEVTAVEKRLHTWSTPSHSKVITMETNDHVSSIPPAVLSFERFLTQTGGHQGGWADIDHQTFLRIRSKFKGDPLYIASAVGELPTKSLDDVRAHDSWYTEYSTLLDNKKLAIVQWRKDKQSAKKATQLSPDILEKNFKVTEALIDKERKKRLAKLSEWKVDRERRRAEATEEERVRAEELCNKTRQREEQRKAEVKARVTDYIHEKKLTEAVLRERQEELTALEIQRRKIANKQVEQFRERDMQMIAERLKKARQKEEQLKIRAAALERTKTAVNVKNDPSRVFRATAGWQERVKAPNTQETRPTILPKRAIPSWRQGL